MATPPPNVQAALASLQERWGGAAPRWGGEVLGALAMAPRPSPGGSKCGRWAARAVAPAPSDERAIPTGFRALDAILGLGGLPRAATTALHGDGTSGKTTLALQAVAQVQAAGGIAAYLDLARSLDPVEAVARGVQLDWLVVLHAGPLEEALAMAAMLLQDRTVDLLLLDLPPLTSDRAGLSAAALASGCTDWRRWHVEPRSSCWCWSRQNCLGPITGALAQIAALRLELSRRAGLGSAVTS